MLCQADTHLQNARERVEQNGNGAELLRQMYLNQLKSYHAAFYEHGSFADVVAICMAFDHLERQGWNVRAPCRASLIESILVLFATRAKNPGRRELANNR
jgi:hypothetical protein